jgi:hypothetical protein
MAENKLITDYTESYIWTNSDLPHIKKFLKKQEKEAKKNE